MPKFIVSTVSVIALSAIMLLSQTSDAEARRRGGGGASSTESCLPGVVKTRLSQIRQRFGSIRVISTYRPGARIRGSGRRSLHASCRAADFRPPNGKYSAVVRWLYANHEGGIGTYRTGHIHIDNGGNYRWSH